MKTVSKKNLRRCYPTSVRINGQPHSIMSDDDLLFVIRQACGDDLHDLVKTRLLYAEEMPDRQCIINAIEEIQSAISDAQRAADSLYDKFEY